MRAFTLRNALARCATRRVGLGALAGVIACVAGLVWRHDRLGGLALLDARGWYTPPEAAALFDALDALDANARLVYATTALTIDMVFPVAYGLLFAIVLVRLFRASLFVLPLALAVSDALERPFWAVRSKPRQRVGGSRARSRSDLSGSSANSVFHTRGVSSTARAEGCSPTRCRTSTR